MLYPDAKTVRIFADRVLIRAEDADVDRIVHMNVTSHDGVPPSLQGHSIGRWDGDALVIDTSNFAANPSGNAFMVPSGPRKHLLERLSLDPDRTSLTYSFELQDSDYLSAPLKAAVKWIHRPDFVPTAEPCDLENAQRHLR